MFKKYIIMSLGTYKNLINVIDGKDIYHYLLEDGSTATKIYGYKLAICNDVKLGKIIYR